MVVGRKTKTPVKSYRPGKLFFWKVSYWLLIVVYFVNIHP
jgi:hypothetical protein